MTFEEDTRPMFTRHFTQHPASVGETYGEHFVAALYFARQLMAASAACLLHALLPFLFEKTASGILARLYERMVLSRHATQGGKRSDVAAEGKPA